ncbi:MAG: DUF134 domain-containing protein [Candidatus Diapherotrites archaeon]|nr:DUF134 domain-containing protein [Candidatus Diapherotrites archaeon]
MPRPKKHRLVEIEPNATYFKPRAIPLSELEEITLSVEEVEALRLRFLQGISQEQAAKRMHISRPTFGRILYTAGKKVSDALINGKAIRIEGGIYKLKARRR